MNRLELSEIIKLTGWTETEFAKWLFVGVKYPTHKLKRVLAGEVELSVSEERAIEELINRTIIVATTDMNFTPTENDVVSFSHKQFTFNWSKSTGIGLLMRGREVVESQMLVNNGTSIKELEELLLEKVNIYINNLKPVEDED